jgi:hypothetical protein
MQMDHELAERMVLALERIADALEAQAYGEESEQGAALVTLDD